MIGGDGEPYVSRTPGTFGGHRRSRIYGRLDCPGALRWIARGYYVRHRVFFADEAAAKAAGYRPCAVCLPGEYQRWRARRDVPDFERRPCSVTGRPPGAEGWAMTENTGLRRRPASEVVVRLIGGLERTPWRPARRTTLVTAAACIGPHRCRPHEDGIVLTKVSLVGGVDLTVAAGTEADVSGFALVGRLPRRGRRSRRPGAWIQVRCYGIFGGVDVHQRCTGRRLDAPRHDERRALPVRQG